MLKKSKHCDENSEQHSEIGTELTHEQEEKSEIVTADDMEFELEVTQDDELNEMEFIVNKREIKLIGENGEEVVGIDDNEIEGSH